MEKQEVQQIREELEAAIRGVAEKHKMSAKVNRIAFGKDYLRTKVEFVSIVKEGEVKDLNWERFHKTYGFVESDFGKEISIQGLQVKCKIVGLTSRRSPQPVIVETIGEVRKKYRVRVETMHKALRGDRSPIDGALSRALESMTISSEDVETISAAEFLQARK